MKIITPRPSQRCDHPERQQGGQGQLITSGTIIKNISCNWEPDIRKAVYHVIGLNYLTRTETVGLSDVLMFKNEDHVIIFMTGGIQTSDSSTIILNSYSFVPNISLRCHRSYRDENASKAWIQSCQNENLSFHGREICGLVFSYKSTRWHELR